MSMFFGFWIGSELVKLTIHEITTRPMTRAAKPRAIAIVITAVITVVERWQAPAGQWVLARLQEL